MRARMRELTSRGRCHKDLRSIIAGLNRVLSGWGAYFRTGNAAIKFVQVTAMWTRLRGLLLKRHGAQLRPGRAEASPLLRGSWALSIKEECLDRIIPIGERHARHVITEFVEHDHRERNHQGLDNRLVASTLVTDRTGRVLSRRRLGGLLNFYERAA